MSEERVNFQLAAPMMAEAMKACGRLTAAEGKRCKMPDLGRSALRFFLDSMLRCPACSAEVKCEIHGSHVLRPEAKQESTVDPADHGRVKAEYLRAFRDARGTEAPFGAREAAAVNKLIDGIGADKAVAAIQNAFADRFWRGRATILTILNDPAQHLGLRSPDSGTRSSLQSDTGYKGGKERR